MIRVANKNDIAKINELGNVFKNNFSKTYNISLYLNQNNYIVLVNEDSLINAFLIVFKNIDCYEIEMIVVDKEFRNNGIATNVINYFVDNFCKKNDNILLEVAKDNLNAINLYKKFDFEIINIRKCYYNGIDAYVMKKVI